MPSMAVVLHRILAHAYARQSGMAERCAIRSPDTAAGRGDRATDAKIGKRSERVPQNRGSFQWTKDAGASCAAGSRIDVEVGVQFGELGLGVLEGSKMLFHVSLRSQQTLLLAAPQRNADRASRLDANRLNDSQCHHHH